MILTPLLPALWLVASVNCLFEPSLGSLSSAPGSFLSAAARQKQEASPLTGSYDQAARRWGRRLDDQSGPGTPSPVTFCRVDGLHLARVPLSASASPVLLALTQGWQFHWRTAAAPRAPSIVS